MTTKNDIKYHLSILRELSATLIGRSQNRYDALEWAIAALTVTSTQPTSAVEAANEPLVTLESALEAIEHMTQYNGRGSECDAAELLVSVTTLPPEAGDERRLNLLSQRGNVVIASDDIDNRWCVELIGGCDSEGEQIITVYEGVTLRAAIDAAFPLSKQKDA